MEIDENVDENIDEPRLRRTLLSQKPRSSSAFVTGISFGIVVLFTQLAWLDPSNTGEKLYVSGKTLFHDHEWWRALTAMLVHADLAHFLSNMSIFAVFSFFVYGHFGGLLFPGMALPAAALVNVLTIMSYRPEVRLVGASGLVYVLGGIWLTLYFLIQRQYGLVSRFVRVIGIGSLLFFPTQYEPSTSYRAHAWGFIFGVVLAIVYFLWHRKFIRNQEVYR